MKRIDPAMRPGGSWISRRIDMEVTDLPHPDSPTMATVSPASMWNDMPSTERTMPSGVPKCVCRFSTSGAVHGPVQLLSHRHQTLFAARGSSASRRPSPIRFTASTVTDRNTAGNSTR